MDVSDEKNLREFVKFFLKENSQINLSALRTEESCWVGNVLDSLAAIPLFSTFHVPLSILDIGTGGGFPLLPLAITFPNFNFTGLDATRKKIDAVARIAEGIGLKNVILACGRAEALGGTDKYREQFDIVTSRAVADIGVLLEYCSPFARPGGKIILWKSMNAEDELKSSERAQKELCCVFDDNYAYELLGGFGKRQLLIFRKTGKLSDKYPRRTGVAKKKPIPKPYIPNDKWSRRAAREGYRARSVYKLMELDDRFRLMRPGMTIVDLGAAPGSWLQYASKAAGPTGEVFGFDLQKIAPVAPNVKTFVIDITNRHAIEDELRKNGVRAADLVLADAAPNTSGVKDMDQWRSVELAQAALAVGKDILKPNGKCVVKVFRGADFDEFFRNLKMDWQEPTIAEPEASRDRSQEVYVIVRKPHSID